MIAFLSSMGALPLLAVAFAVADLAATLAGMRSDAPRLASIVLGVVVDVLLACTLALLVLGARILWHA